jgi:hypothetical protein
MLLFCIVKFGPTAQICAKTPKFETPFSPFSRTHARGLLMAHSTPFFPPIFNRVNEASLRSPDKPLLGWLLLAKEIQRLQLLTVV